MTNEELKGFTNKLDLFRSSHTKVELGDRRGWIKEQYELFTKEFYGEVESSIAEDDESIDIKLRADSFLSCEDGGHSLNVLVGQASMTQVEVVDSKVEIRLWFRCWEWAEK